MIDFKQLTAKYQTPLYIYDFDYMATQYEELKAAFKGRKSIVAYAVKANSNLSVVGHFAKMGSGADCVSIGEVRRAFLAGIPAYKIIFSGVGKRDEEIREAIQKDILYINADVSHFNFTYFVFIRIRSDTMHTCIYIYTYI